MWLLTKLKVEIEKTFYDSRIENEKGKKAFPAILWHDWLHIGKTYLIFTVNFSADGYLQAIKIQAWISFDHSLIKIEN